MRYFLMLLWLLAFATVTTTVAVADDPKPSSRWKEFKSEKGGFKVLMAAKPQHEDIETENEIGKSVLHMHTIFMGRAMYAANYNDFSEKILEIPLANFYDSSRDSAAANMQGKVVSEKDSKLGEHPGREFVIEVNGGKELFRARVFLIKQRLFQVVVFGKKDLVTNKEADQFLDSFELLEQPK